MSDDGSLNHTSPFTEGCFAPYNENYEENTSEEKYVIVWSFVTFIIAIFVINLKEWKNPILASFSFTKNIKSIFTLTPLDNEISCFHGIKAITLLILIGVHSYLIRAALHDQSSEVFQENFAQKEHIIVDFLASTVDTFFVVSAILLTRSVLVDLKKKNFNILRTTLSRYFRLTPSVVFLLIFDKVLLFVVRGKFNCNDVFCYVKWWENIFHIQNLFHQTTSMMCHIWTWYLAVDWQMSFIAPIFIYALFKFQWKGVGFMSSLIIGVSAYRVYAFDSMNIQTKSFFDLSNDTNMYIRFFGVYASTLTRGASYLIGIVIGFIIEKYESKAANFNLPKKYQVFFWLYVSQWLVFPQMFKIPCELTDCQNNIMFFVFESAHKIIWSLSIGWIIIACHFKIGGVVNTILSSKFWMPIAKISLSLYLIHPTVIMNFVSTHPKETNFEVSNVMINYLSDLAMSLTVAVFVFITIEEPFRHIGKMLTKKLFN